MPNWCENQLEIMGNKTQLSRFKKEVKDEDRDLSLHLLCPLKTDESATEQWGTKWDVDSVEDGDMPIEICLHYTFMSAWSPPREAILQGSKKYPLLKFILRYDEPGMCYSGVFMCENGNIVKDNCIDYDWPSEK